MRCATFVSIATIALFLAAPAVPIGTAGASAVPSGAGREPAAPSTPGALLVTQPDGTLVEMPLRHTSVAIEVSAFIARATIEQTFANPLDHLVEAVYTFPLGDRAAVDDFELVVGDRTIRGEIKRREEARAVYEEARSSGYQAALLEQERPNIFTQSVANLEPGKEIRVRIRTVETLVYEKGSYKLTFPLVVGPRYIPGGAAAAVSATSAFTTAGSAAGTTSPTVAQPVAATLHSPAVTAPVRSATEPIAPNVRVPDAHRITSPVLLPGFRSGHDVDISITLDAGVAITALTSPSHKILAEQPSATTARVRIAPEDSIPNKDFLLRWSVSSARPAVGLLAHRDGVDGFFTLLVQPRGEVDAASAAPKEIIVVVDTSGSMSGIPLEASKRFLARALREMGPRDTFNLIRFSGDNEVFTPGALPNTAANVEKGIAWMDRLQGGGGTEMLPAIRAAFARPADPERLRIVVFLTDGYVGNDPEILQEIATEGGSARVYTVGIGTSVNHFLLDRMADLGRGAYVFVRPDERADDAVESFRSWVTRPYLTDLSIDWGSLPVADVSPERLRDLGSGQTLAVVGRYLAAGRGEVVVRGRLAGRYWEQRLEVELPETEPRHDALGSLWARGHIEELLRESPGSVPDSVRAEVTTLALEHRLMSPFTSFVAVDDSRVVNPGGKAPLVRQALPIPEGTTFEGVFGSAGPAGMRGGPERATEDLLEARADRDRGGLLERVATLVAGRTASPPTKLGSPGYAGSPSSRSAKSGSPGGAAGGGPTSGALPGSQTSKAKGEKKDDMRATVEGVSNADPLSGTFMSNLNADAIEGIEVVTSGASAEYGSAVGGYAGVVSGQPSPNGPSGIVAMTFTDTFGRGSDLPVLGPSQQSILTMAPGVTSAASGAGPNIHGVGERDFRSPIRRSPSSSASAGSLDGGGSADSAGAARLRELSIRVLADLADDGRLTPSEGKPALAALLAAQRPSGAIATDVAVHSIATWALAEAAARMDRDPWVTAAATRAADYLVGLATPAGWPVRPGGAIDAEASRWARLALRASRGRASGIGGVPAGTPSRAYSRVRTAILTGRTGSQSSKAASAAAFDRLIATIGRGHLKITS